MTEHHITFDRPNYSNSDTLILALFVAVTFHIILALTVSFTKPKQDRISRSVIDVTLTMAPVKKPPKKAKFLGADNQEGAGTVVRKAKPPMQQLPSHAEPNQIQNHEPPVKRMLSERPEDQDIKNAGAKKTITRQKSEKKVLVADRKVEQPHKQEERPHLDAETLRQQIAQVGSEIKYNPEGSDNNKAKTLAQVSAHKFVAAQYIHDWESKVERTGNMNFPEAAAKKGSQTLTMDVGIKADGSIQNIRIRHSSGNKALDDAAKHIVTMAAPFAPLPSALLKELNVLVITRKWQFSDESGMTTP
jgi:periplasmic protein TonB